MSSSRSRVMTLARHEYRAAVRSRALISLVAILAIVTFVSIYIAAIAYRSALADYQAYVAAAQAGGVQLVAPSPLRLLSLLRGAIEYIEIVGAIIAITLGYLTVSRERANRTLPLLRSRPVTTGELATGSALGALGIISTLVLVTGIVALLCLGLIGNSWATPYEVFKVGLVGVASVLYMFVFYSLGALITARTRVAANGLLISLGIWLLIVLILPQIGDTLDADNQIPGGLFSALAVDKAQETQILTHFGTYEFIRTGIEELSFAKHYERFAFAMSDVQDKYQGFTLAQLAREKWHDIVWMFAYAIALGYGLWRGFRRQPALPQGEKS